MERDQPCHPLLEYIIWGQVNYNIYNIYLLLI